MQIMTLPGNLEQRLLEMDELLTQFSPRELGPWIEFLYVERMKCSMRAQQSFITFVLAKSQRLYRATHDSYYERQHDSFS